MTSKGRLKHVDKFVENYVDKYMFYLLFIHCLK